MGGAVKGQIGEKRKTSSESCGSGCMVTHFLFRFGSGKRLYPNGPSGANPDAKMSEAS